MGEATAQKTKHFLIDVRPTEAEHSLDWAFLSVGPEKARQVLLRRKLFLDAREVDANLDSMEFWDYGGPAYYDGSLVGLLFTTPQLLQASAKKEGWLEVEHDIARALKLRDLVPNEAWRALGEEERAAQNIECPFMVVELDGVMWRAYPKHQDVLVFTQKLPYSTFEEAL